MANLKIRILILAIISLMFACEYEPSDVFHRKVDKNVSPPNIQVVELNLEEDSIFLYLDKEVHFLFTSNSQSIKAVSFVIDDKESITINSNTGDYNLSSGNLSNGEHILTLKIITNSGTGSIADHLGVEGFISSKSWILVVNKNFLSETRAIATNGYLKIEWARYRAPDLGEYIFYKLNWWTSWQEVKRLKSIECFDSSYVGEGGSYMIQVRTKDNQLIDWGFVQLGNNLPVPHLEVAETNQYRIWWNKNKYYNAVDTCNLFEGIGFNGQFVKARATCDLNDTIYNTNAIFGDNLNIKLKFVPKQDNINYLPSGDYGFETQFSTLAGYHFVSPYCFVTSIYQVKKDEFIFNASYDSIVRYSLTQKKSTQKLSYDLVGCSTIHFNGIRVSPNGKFFTARVGCNFDIMLSSSENLANNEVYDLPFLNDQYAPPIPVSDPGTGVIPVVNGGFYVYDFINDSILGYYIKDDYSTTMPEKISSLGDYIFAADDSLRLLQFKDSKFKNINSQSRLGDIRFYQFDALINDQLVLWDGTEFYVKRCQDFSNVHSFPLVSDGILNIDYYNREILSYSAGHLYVNSLTNGTLLYDIEIHFEPTGYNYCHLIDHTIVCDAGIMYYLK
jgi:hypothetical protein